MKKALSISFGVMFVVALLAACAPGAVPTAPITIAPSTAKPDTQPVDTVVVPAVETTPLRTVSVTGNGQVFLVPDVAYVYIGVHSQSENVSEALNSNNEQAKAVTEALKKLNVDSKDIQTTSFNIFPQQQYEPNTGKVTSTIYMIDNTVYVTVRDLKKLGDMLDVVVRSGANSINGITFDVVDKESAMSEARGLAITNARKQAEELAKASGVSLGDVQAITTSTAGTPFMAKELGYGGMGGGGGVAASSQAPVSAGQLVLSVDVSLTFAIK
jgi:uncharacterized protein YggE